MNTIHKFAQKMYKKVQKKKLQKKITRNFE